MLNKVSNEKYKRFYNHSDKTTVQNLQQIENAALTYLFLMTSARHHYHKKTAKYLKKDYFRHLL